jgi:hypothetical protein
MLTTLRNVAIASVLPRLLVALPLPFFAMLLACGGEQPPPAAAPSSVASAAPPPASATSLPPASTPAPAPASQEEAHKLVTLAASCWFGGLWSDALGEQDQAKQSGNEARCHDLAMRVWSSDDKPHVEQLRALETSAVADVVAKVDLIAKTDAVDGRRRAALVSLATALGDAQKETMLARRAADRVKRDLDREPDKLTGDEIDAVIPLRSHAKIEALYRLDAGDVSAEARALALLCALDRVEAARGLPKHLKLYAVADEFKLLFGVAIPDVPADASKKLVPGTWLTFLTQTAAAAGHPVSDKAKTARERDALAWAGMLEGMSDKLKTEADAVSTTTDLSKVVTVVLHRLEAEYHAQQTAEATKQKPTTQKPAAQKPKP